MMNMNRRQIIICLFYFINEKEYIICYNLNYIERGGIMSKVKIKTLLRINSEQEEKELTGIIQDNKLKFRNEPYITTFDYNTNTLVNESDETRLEITFDKTKTESNYLLKNYNKEANFNIKTKNITIDKYNIDIEYTVLDTNEEFNYRIEVIE